MIRAAIVGLGRWGRNLVGSVQGRSERLRFTHAVVRRPDAARDFATQHGLELSADYGRTLSDAGIQAVVLATPHSLHAGQIAAAAAAGKAVFCEKPLALKRADAARAIEACRRNGVALGLGYNKRFWPSMQEMKRIVESRALGSILHVEGHFSNETTGRFYSGWRGENAESPAGGLTATGVHVLDAFVGLAGPVRRVSAQLLGHGSGPEPLDALTVVFEFSSRASGTLACVRSTPQFWRVHVFGRNGSAEALEDTDLVVRMAGAPPQRRTFESVDALRLELEAFAHSVATGAPFPIPFDQMLDGVAALEAITESLATGRPVVLGQEER
jgi:predicted dehydrogenase